VINKKGSTDLSDLSNGVERTSLDKSVFTPLFSPKNIAPLITFRILFGLLMLVGAIRFVANGWVESLYIEPRFFFKFYGFEWVQPLSESGMYALMGMIMLSALCIMLGFLYRVMTILFFLSFTYLELIDATNYLNHYYLVCLLALLLIFLPAHKSFSLDAKLWPSLRAQQVPAWTILILMFQLTLVYFFAGLAKLNADWLFSALPVKIWLREHVDLPLLGYFFQFSWVAFVFSWFGALYDLTIAFFLMNSRTRGIAYFFVVVFHLMTWLLFNIGLFPVIMIFNTLIFFPARMHERWLAVIGYQPDGITQTSYSIQPFFKKVLPIAIASYAIIQIALPLRHLAYTGNPMWTQEGYRFSWRVMLMETSGNATFYIEDKVLGRKTELNNANYLTTFQEKEMSTKPDFMIQYAHYLAELFREKHGFHEPIVTVDAFVALNGRVSKRLIQEGLNLAEIEDGLGGKAFILKDH